MLGRNLRLLMADKGPVSSVSREIGINRTQFNRYGSILRRACQFRANLRNPYHAAVFLASGASAFILAASAKAVLPEQPKTL